MISRRTFLLTTGVACGGAVMRGTSRNVAAAANTRRYHVCLTAKAVAANPDLLRIVADSGVTDIWQLGYLYGHWGETPEGLKAARARVEQHGLGWHVINVPLGHPGDSLGDQSGETPLTPPGAWKFATRPDGTKYSGTSIHPPATAQNVAAVRELAALNPDIIFLDDDFRLATGPGVIGGCYCDTHKKTFLDAHGYAPGRWDELLDDVAHRRLTPLLRAWVDATCDELGGCFRAQQAAAPGVALGNMVMYLGAEKAGIRLAEYVDVPFRVGELMFNDASFNRLKGKTDELFSALFHRRFAQPQLAYSETTAYPADQLSAKNMAAKLAVSTLCDVRNTMYMSGLTPFPQGHWETLAPAMREQARIHEILKGHTPRGPFKHYWGEASRYVGNDDPFSLFLAAGIPFEVSDQIPDDGWTFLSDADAAYPGTGAISSAVCRPDATPAPPGMRTCPESMEALWKLKKEALDAGIETPFIADEKPAVCAWYPTAAAVLIWNLSEARETFDLHWANETRQVEVDGLGTALVRGNHA